MGITDATQNAFNRIWSVPFKHRPNFLRSRLRGLGMLGAARHAGDRLHRRRRLRRLLEPRRARPSSAGVVVAFAFNLALFMLAFKLLTADDLSWRELLPGVIVAAVFWQLLQHLGGYYVDHELKRTGAAVRRLRARARAARVAVPRRPADDLRRRDQRRPPAQAVAAQLLLRPAARGRQARARPPPPRSRSASMSRTSRSASRRRSRDRGQDRPARRRRSPMALFESRPWLSDAISGMTAKYLRTQPPRAILTKLS